MPGDCKVCVMGQARSAPTAWLLAVLLVLMPTGTLHVLAQTAAPPAAEPVAAPNCTLQLTGQLTQAGANTTQVTADEATVREPTCVFHGSGCMPNALGPFCVHCDCIGRILSFPGGAPECQVSLAISVTMPSVQAARDAAATAATAVQSAVSQVPVWRCRCTPGQLSLQTLPV